MKNDKLFCFFFLTLFYIVSLYVILHFCCVCEMQCDSNSKKEQVRVTQRFDTVEDFKQSKPSENRIYLAPGTKIDSETLDALKKLGKVIIIEKPCCIKFSK